MEFTIAKGFLDLAKGLLGFKAALSAENQQKKERISQFLAKISECLESIATGLKQGTSVTAKCGELSEYMDSLMQVLQGVVDHEVLEKYSKLLSQAAIARGLAAELKEGEASTAGIKIIEEAAGRFRGLANVLIA